MGKVIMVTGGTGLVGSAIREVIEAENIAAVRNVSAAQVLENM